MRYEEYEEYEGYEGGEYEEGQAYEDAGLVRNELFRPLIELRPLLQLLPRQLQRHQPGDTTLVLHRQQPPPPPGKPLSVTR